MLTIQLKRLGKKKIKKLPFVIEIIPKTLRELLEKCVKAEVKQFNNKKENNRLLPFLSADDMQEQSEQGKIGIGDSANNTLAVETVAIENVMQGFEDGLFVVFINDDEVKTLDETITMNQESVISFIRMTFLSGTYW